jgi:hypothetical protein
VSVESDYVVVDLWDSPHPEERAIARVSKDEGGFTLRDAAKMAAPQGEDIYSVDACRNACPTIRRSLA